MLVLSTQDRSPISNLFEHPLWGPVASSLELMCQGRLNFGSAFRVSYSSYSLPSFGGPVSGPQLLLRLTPCLIEISLFEDVEILHDGSTRVQFWYLRS